MRLRLSARAENDLTGIAAYLYAHAPHAAQHIQNQFTVALQLLGSHPQAGRRVGRGLRRFAIPRLPYLIYYRIDDLAAVLEIITVRHSARAPLSRG